MLATSGTEHFSCAPLNTTNENWYSNNLPHNNTLNKVHSTSTEILCWVRCRTLIVNMASPPSKILQCPLREAQRTSTFYREAIRQIWSLDLTPQEYRQDEDLYESYFTHVFWELCHKAGGGDSSIRDLTYDQIFGIVQILKIQTWTKATTKEHLQQGASPLDAALTERAVNLAAALLVPLNFKNSGGARRGEVISWDENETLSNMIAKRVIRFPAHQKTCASCAQNGRVRYAKNFNARQLSKIAGFEIIWTSNLVDHLLLQDQDDSVKVHIFHQLRSLQNHSSIARFAYQSPLAQIISDFQKVPSYPKS